MRHECLAALKDAGQEDDLVTTHRKGSKYPIFKVSGPKTHEWDGFFDLKTSNVGLLDPPGMIS